ncbi:MAG: aminotransferase class V-fold PLP-dependent enzyme, partial [candidate division Zixibacteria bacterium]|nr:aminotransferase class V-fold PLP-dependent enzyme [candidate division Zixibacteria bacterium]
MNTERSIYFDHQSTTPVDKRVLDHMLPYFSESYGNPSSFIHKQGVVAGEALDKAREQVAALIKSKSDEIIFTSSATESNNLAVKGYLQANADKGRHIVASAIEHYSILNQFPALRESGYEIIFVACDNYGMVDPEAVKKALRDDTAMIIVQTASSEIGTIQNIADIGKLAGERGIFFHSDAAIAGGNVPIDVGALPVDSLTLSA